MKKRGFGEGKWNGVGGKVNADETIELAALRELKEEIGVESKEEHLESMGILKFRSENSKFNWDCHVYFLKSWQGEPTESEEMRPQWYSFDQIPFGSMWVDDKYWLPLVIGGDKINADFFFNNEGNEILKMNIKKI